MSSLGRCIALYCSFIGVYARPDNCPGYSASKAVRDPSSFQAELHLIGPGCSIFGPDLPQLGIRVEYQTGTLSWLYQCSEMYTYLCAGLPLITDQLNQSLVFAS